jgi:hypothetical protein
MYIISGMATRFLWIMNFISETIGLSGDGRQISGVDGTNFSKHESFRYSKGESTRQDSWNHKVGYDLVGLLQASWLGGPSVQNWAMYHIHQQTMLLNGRPRRKVISTHKPGHPTDDCARPDPGKGAQSNPQSNPQLNGSSVSFYSKQSITLESPTHTGTARQRATSSQGSLFRKRKRA